MKTLPLTALSGARRLKIVVRALRASPGPWIGELVIGFKRFEHIG